MRNYLTESSVNDSFVAFESDTNGTFVYTCCKGAISKSTCFAFLLSGNSRSRVHVFRSRPFQL